MPTEVYKRTEENTRKMSESLLGREFSIRHRQRLSKAGKLRKQIFGHKHTEEWKKKFSESQFGENNPNWKGGITLKHTEKNAGRPKPKVCEVCGGGGMIVFDHDHKTNKFRAWLCQSCNSVIGFVKENTKLLRKLADWLDSFKD